MENCFEQNNKIERYIPYFYYQGTFFITKYLCGSIVKNKSTIKEASIVNIASIVGKVYIYIIVVLNDAITVLMMKQE